MSNNTLPAEVQEQIEQEAKDFKKKPHYKNGDPLSCSPQIYLERGYIAGATEWAVWKVKYDELKGEVDDLKRWKREACMVIDPIIEYGQGHKDAKLGRSITEFVIERCKEYDRIKDKADKMEAALREIIKDIGSLADGDIFEIASKALQQWNDEKKEATDPCPSCGKYLSRDRNLCCRECGKEVERA